MSPATAATERVDAPRRVEAPERVDAPGNACMSSPAGLGGISTSTILDSDEASELQRDRRRG
eukprot:scaffold34862_cov61-Phaeocystis_antarctica.AAC.4